MKDVKIPILIYHNIDMMVSNDIYTISLSNFRSHMDWFSAWGYTSISLNDLISWRINGNNIPDKPIIITFDDGYTSCYSLAFPALRTCSFKASFFITTERVGKKDYLKWEEIRKMKENGMEFGSHGHQHIPLTKLNQHDIQYELKTSKTILENNLGMPANFLSLPGGYFNDEVKQIAKGLGYKAVLTSNFGINENGMDLYALRRIGVRGYYSHSNLERLINNKPTLGYRADRIFRNILKKSLGDIGYIRVKQWVLKYDYLKRKSNDST